VLAETGEALASSLDSRDTLQQVADLCVPELADWCAVSLPDEHEQLRTVAVAHTDPAKVALAQRVGERYPVALDEPGGAAQVFRGQSAMSTNDITDEMLVAAAKDEEHLEALRGLGMHAALVVPMTSGGRSIGVLSLVSAESGRSFGEEDVALAGELARRAATAVENARLYTERSRIARTLQTSLLPDALPHLPGWRTTTLYRPAGDENQVGGDFYEAVPLDGDWMLVVGDVTGRGAPAAALTGLMRHTLRTAATITGSATGALDKLNADLIARPQLSLCTAVCLVLRDRAGRVQADILCAGHPPPILIRGGAAEEVGRFGPMLGAYSDARWDPLSLSVHPGDVLVLYSDGLIDATGPDDRFGAERLRQTLIGASGAQDAMARIKQALADFQVGAQADDTAVLAVERVGTLADLVTDGPGRAGGRMRQSSAAPSADVPHLT
jgi:serine phosphatase RsbU (regulator of sigma subunit)